MSSLTSKYVELGSRQDFGKERLVVSRFTRKNAVTKVRRQYLMSLAETLSLLADHLREGKDDFFGTNPEFAIRSVAAALGRTAAADLDLADAAGY